MMKTRVYPAIIERSEDGFGVVFPDVPGCVSAGDTLDEAIANAAEALKSHLELLAEAGEPIPEPSSSFDQLPDWLSGVKPVAWITVEARV